MEALPSTEKNTNSAWRILIIDDDEDDYILAREMLKDARGRKFDVVWANTFERGREELAAGHYHAVLVDYDLGAHSGIELIREASRRGYASPLILFTGRGNYEVDVEAMEAGATLYLTKGEVNPLLLERAIRYAIELKQKEQALMKAEERFTKAFHSSPAALAITRAADSRYIEANESLCQMMGYPRDEIIGRTALELGLYEDPVQRAELIHLLHEQGTVRNYEVAARTKTGSLRTLLGSFDLVELDNEPCLLATLIDITERKRIESQLRKVPIDRMEELRHQQQQENERARLEAVLQALPVGVWIADQSGQLIFKNKQTDQIWGGDVPLSGSIEGYRDYVAWFMDSGILVAAEDYPVAQALITGEPARPAELLIQRFDGTQGAVLAIGAPIKDAQGRLSGAVAVNLDITERKQVEQALRLSEERFYKAFDANPNAQVISRVADGRIESINDGFVQLFGYSRDEALGKTSTELCMFANPADRDEAVRRLRAEKFLRDFELAIRRKSGEFRQASLSVDFIELDGQKLMLTVIQDITKRKIAEQALRESEEKLKRSNQELEQFAFVASHDLKEPLRKIILFGDLLRSEAKETLGEQSLQYLERMQNASERMQVMINGLLELSRVNRQGKEFTRIHLKKLVEEVLSDLEPRIQAVGGEVRTGDLPTIEADELQMRQLFQNLIGNAIKFHRPGVPPLVQVTGTNGPAKKAALVEIRVEDNGIGIEQQDAERIFQPFQRLHGRNEYEGSGLGLAICQRIVERHHGTIEVQSVSNQGAAFIIRLPAKQTGN